MNGYAKIVRGKYIDSLETLFKTARLTEQPGIETGYVCMGNVNNKSIINDMGLLTAEIEAAGVNDLIVAARAENEAAFEAALTAIEDSASSQSAEYAAYSSVKAATAVNKDVNVCVISVPGEFVKREALKALDAGLHLVIFSAHVPLEQERAIKEYARDRGLLCMGPDCGVVNLNGKAFVLASITNRGPVGIVGASGIGVQYVGAMLHKAGSGVSQIIGTGGNDTKDAVGAITTLQGIDALEADAQTKFIVLIARKVENECFGKIMRRVEKCKKPIVVYFMGTQPEDIAKHGGIWAANLEDTAKKAIELTGKSLRFESEADLCLLAETAAQGMAPEQRYVRGAFVGGTYCNEAIHTLTGMLGGIYSNAPAEPEWLLKDSAQRIAHSLIDYGEEEFTAGRPHPTIDPGIRLPAIMEDASDPSVAVLLLDFVLTPSGPKDPVGPAAAEISKAKDLVKKRGGELAVIASVCGTGADIQNLDVCEETLRRAGAYVCMSNHKAAYLAGQIVKHRKG